MKSALVRYSNVLAIALALLFVLANALGVNGQASKSSSTIPPTQLVQPEELAKIIQSAKSPKPLIFYIGYRVLYLQAHIPNSEYIGPASEPQGIQRLRQRVQALPHKQAIVIYCGCCPWDKCPNVHPAYQELHTIGFSNVKVLYIGNNFGKDWVDKGYPAAKGE